MYSKEFGRKGGLKVIVYKMDVLAALKESGYNTGKIRKYKLIGESALQQIRNKELVSWKNVDTLCRLLSCNVGDIVEYQQGTAEPCGLRQPEGKQPAEGDKT